MKSFLLRLFVFIQLGLLVSCAVGPDYTRPNVVMASQFKEIGEWKLAKPQDDVVRGRWWEIYADPVLNQLMDKVALSNQNIVVAQAQYEQAMALLKQAYANFFPALTANAGYTKNSINSSSTVSKPYSVNLQAAWEIDLWGAIRRNVEAGKASAASSLANVEVVKLSAYLALAQAYFQLRISDLQRTAAQQNVQSYTRALAIARARYQSGTNSQVDLITADNQLESAKITLSDLDIQRAQAEHAIAVLIGQDPSHFKIESLANWKTALPIFPVMVPTQLLERRPDIAAAERNVAAANAKIGVAQAAYFPSLNIDASGGYQSSVFRRLFDLPNRIWSVGSSVAATIFDAGAINAQVMQAKAAYDQTVASYRQTVLGAIQEVEDNLSALNTLNSELSSQEKIVRSSNQSMALVLNQYHAGVADYLNVITALTSSQSNENARLLLLGRYYSAHVGLIAALGGGWHSNSQQRLGRGSF